MLYEQSNHCGSSIEGAYSKQIFSKK